MKEIQLTQGKIALVDDEDFYRVSLHKWQTRQSTSGCWYAFAKINGENISLHSYILPPKDGFVIDHKSGDGLDNRRSNLRHATVSQNMANQKQHRDSKSPYKGIWRAAHCDRWAAQIVCKRRKIYLGVYQKAEDAARAYDAKARELFGFFAKTNFPAVPQ